MKHKSGAKQPTYNEKELLTICQTLQDRLNRNVPKHQTFRRIKRINEESKERKLLEMSRRK